MGFDDKTEVSVIGLGLMGSALARALLRGGHRVTVWNRTRSKAETLKGEGAEAAADLAVALEASPVIIVCVRDYDVAHDLLFGADASGLLSGRTLVQLGGGTPQEARDGQRRALDIGAAYLDGEILVYPEQIGAPEATILVAGAEAVFRRHEPLLGSLAGTISYVGEHVGAANAYGLAMGSIIYGSYLGALHGARVCEVEGLGIDAFATRLGQVDMQTIGAGIIDLLKRVQSDRYDESQATLQTGADGAEQLLLHARRTGLDQEYPECSAAMFRRGIDAGLAEEDVAALIKVLRTPEGVTSEDR